MERVSKEEIVGWLDSILNSDAGPINVTDNFVITLKDRYAITTRTAAKRIKWGMPSKLWIPPDYLGDDTVVGYKNISIFEPRNGHDLPFSFDEYWNAVQKGKEIEIFRGGISFDEGEINTNIFIRDKEKNCRRLAVCEYRMFDGMGWMKFNTFEWEEPGIFKKEFRKKVEKEIDEYLFHLQSNVF